MSDSFSCRYEVKLDSQQKWDDGQSVVTDPFKVKAAGVPECTGELTEAGSGATLADRHYRSKIELTAAQTWELDLLYITDNNGNTFAFASVKLMYLAIRSPTANKVIEIDPAAASSDGWSFTQNAIIVEDQYLQTKRLGGVTVNTGEQNLHLKNTGSEALIADLLLVGVEV